MSAEFLALVAERRAAKAALRAGRAEAARASLDHVWERTKALPDETSVPRADLVRQLAEDYQQLGDASRARELGACALAIEEQLDRPVILRGLLMFLATLHGRLGEAPRAVELAKRALRLYRRDLGPDHAEVVTIRSFIETHANG